MYLNRQRSQTWVDVNAQSEIFLWDVKHAFIKNSEITTQCGSRFSVVFDDLLIPLCHSERLRSYLEVTGAVDTRAIDRFACDEAGVVLKRAHLVR